MEREERGGGRRGKRRRVEMGEETQEREEESGVDRGEWGRGKRTRLNN